jgi:hypothetical protein
MPDITVFKMEIDDSTFNAPFGGRTRSDGAQTTDESSGLNVKLVAGLGAVFLLTGTALVFLLKRRFGGNDEDEDSEDSEDSENADTQREDSEDSEDEDEQENGGIRAVIGLSFLMISAAIVKRKIRAGSETASRTIHRNPSLQD